MKKLIKKISPPGVVKKFKKAYDNLDYFFVRIGSKSRFFSNIYYLIFSKAFLREHYGVLYGRLKYQEESRSKQHTQYLLRRNIHGLEKGILMKPRKALFGLDYIEDTILSYEKAIQDNEVSNPSELQWSHDVLNEYFRVVSAHPIVDKARDRFNNINNGMDNEIKRIPYQRDISCPPPVSYEQLLELAHRRKSVRWFIQQPVPREMIDKAIVLASLSPSACNRQPFEFRVFDDPDLVQKISSLPAGTRGFFHNFPVIIAVVGKLSAYFSERDRHLIYIDASLASMSFMLALETQGLSSCPLNWPDVDRAETQIARYLHLSPDERVIMLIALGFPDPNGLVAYSQKKDLNVLRRYNQEL